MARRPPARRDGVTVLDVGSGAGHATAILAETFPHHEVVAVDPTPQFVRRATERFTELALDGRVRAVHGEIGGPALAELAPADLVWCANIVHHLPAPVAALRDLGQLLTPDGVLAVAEGGLPARFLPGGYGVARPSRTFLLDLPAPVHDEVRAYVVDRFTTIRELIGDRLNTEDAAALSRLLDPNDPAAFVSRPDLFVLSATTVHLATRS